MLGGGGINLDSEDMAGSSIIWSTEQSRFSTQYGLCITCAQNVF
ncbi:rCG61399, partial [Rattus norvegicus]